MEKIMAALQGAWDDANAQLITGDNSKAHAQYLRGFCAGIHRAMEEVEFARKKSGR